MNVRTRIASLVLALAAPAAWAGLDAPLTGTGGFRFVADAPVFHDGDAKRADLAVMVRNDEISFFVDDAGRRRAQLTLEVKLARKGVVSVDSTQVFVLFADDVIDAAASTNYQLLEMSLPVSEGRWAMTLRVRDHGADRGRLALDGVVAEAQGVLDVARWPATGARLSDPEFRHIAEDGSWLPQPERLFGVAQDTLHVYLELDRARSGQSYVVDVEVYDPIFGGIDGESLVLRPTAAKAATLYQLPLGSFPQGSYRIRFKPQWRPDFALEAEFAVNWRMHRVAQAGREVEVEGSLVFDGELYDRFHAASHPTQIDMLERFWDSVDPTPGTAANEIYDRFLERVEYAERFYSEFGKHGALTARGRTFVHYGRPRAVEVEVVPLNGDELDDTIGKVHDAYRMDRTGSAAKDAVNIAHLDLGQRDSERNQARIGQEGAFELWVYRLHGEPLFGERQGWSEDLDLRFLFVDRLGTGDYRLEYSNLHSVR